MGFDLDRFISPVDEEFLCSICYQVLYEPKQLIKCQHIFCGSCINESLKRIPNCPICKKENFTTNIISPPKIFINLLSKLIIKCDFASFDCDSLVILGDLASHVEKCLFNPEKKFTCEDGCEKIMTIKEFIRHTCTLDDVVNKNIKLKTEMEEKKQENRELKEKTNTLKSEIDRMGKTLEQVMMGNEIKATMRLKFKKLSELDLKSGVASCSYIFVRNLKWRIKIQSKVTVENGTEREWFGIFLQVRNVLDERQWECKASCDFKLVSQTTISRNISLTLNEIFTSNGYSYGFPQFLILSDVLDQSNGYIKCDSIICEVEIRAEQVKFTNQFDGDPDNPHEFLKAIRSSLNHSLVFKKGDIIEHLYPISSGNQFMGLMKDGRIDEFHRSDFEKIENLSIECDFTLFGCGDLFANLGELASHVEKCGFNPVKQGLICEVGCFKVKMIEELVEHTCALEDVLKKNKELKEIFKGLEEEKEYLKEKNENLRSDKERTKKTLRELTGENKSEATLRFEIDELNVFDLKKGVLTCCHVYLQNLKWRILIQSKKVDKDSSWLDTIVNWLPFSSKKKEYFGIYLLARNVLDESEWECSVSFDVKLISNKEGVGSKQETLDRIFTSNLNAFGYQFMPLSDLLDPSKHYIKENSIICEVTIRAEQAQFIDRDPKKPREFVKAIKDYDGSNDWLAYKKGDIIEQLYPIDGYYRFMGKLQDGRIGEYRSSHVEKTEYL